MIGEQGENLVYLLGLPRSGTTLLSVLLNQHPRVHCPSEPWLMLALEAIGRTPDTDPADAAVLYHAMEEFLSDEMHIDAARVYARHAYNSKLAESGKTIFVDKTPRYYLILPFIQRVFPKARYVLLLRNPMDVAASMKQAWRFDLKHEFEHKQDALGSVDLNLGLRHLMTFACNPAHPAFFVRYEELVREPLRQMTSVFQFLGLDPAVAPTETTFDVANSPLAKSVVGDKKILETQSPHARSIDSWKRVFSRDESQAVLDAVGPGMLRDLGYGSTLQDAAEMGIELRDESIAIEHYARLQDSVMARVHKYTACVTFAELLSARGELAETLGAPLPLDPMARVNTLIERTRQLKAAAAAEPGAQAAELQRTLDLATARHAAEIAELRGQLAAEQAKNVGLAASLDRAAAEVEAFEIDHDHARIALETMYQAAAHAVRRSTQLSGRLRELINQWPLKAAWKLRLQTPPHWAAEENHDFPTPTLVNAVIAPTQRLRDWAESVRHLRHQGADPMSAALLHLMAKGFRPKVILDIGAAKGYWSEMVQYRFFPHADYYLIDPLAESEENLQKLSQRSRRFNYILCAVGSKPGVVKMSIGQDRDASSLLPFPGDHATRDVPVETIDGLLAQGRVPPPDLVKIDVQGFELEVLAGAARLFETTEVFIIEVNLFEFMPGTPLADRVIAHMASKGYRVYDIAGELRRPIQNDLAQMDIVFVKNNSPLVRSNQWK